MSAHDAALSVLAEQGQKARGPYRLVDDGLVTLAEADDMVLVEAARAARDVIVT
jgi:hypothetical protein